MTVSRPRDAESPFRPSALRVLEEVRRCLAETPCARWLVAFSGGPDSLALAWACSQLRLTGGLHTTLAHLDHGLDPESRERASAARQLAARLDLPIVISRAEEARPSGTSLEAWAREQRYRFLHREARLAGAERIATAHHADDQAETLLLRLLYGTGLEGLSGIRRAHGRVVRPLVHTRRQLLQETLKYAGLEPTQDPTNRDLRRPRNRIRALVLPEWTRWEPVLIERLAGVASRASRLTQRLDRVLGAQIGLRSIPGGGAAAGRQQIESLPSDLLPHALSTLDRAAERPLPTSRSARSELIRQMTAGHRVGCDAGEDWRWHGDRLALRLLPPQKPMPQFTYNLEVPGSVSVSELKTQLRITSAPSRTLGSPEVERTDRFLARLPAAGRCRVEIRNRRPGDRLKPAGRRGEKRLKEVLIDQHFPREMRDRLPLLVVDGRIAWVPGVTYDETFLARTDEPAWLVELRPETESPRDSNDERGSTP